MIDQVQTTICVMALYTTYKYDQLTNNTANPCLIIAQGCNIPLPGKYQYCYV